MPELLLKSANCEMDYTKMELRVNLVVDMKTMQSEQEWDDMCRNLKWPTAYIPETNIDWDKVYATAARKIREMQERDKQQEYNFLLKLDNGICSSPVSLQAQPANTPDMPRPASEPTLSGTDARLLIVDDDAPVERPSGLTSWLPDCLREWRDDSSLRALFHPVVCKPEYSRPFRKYTDGRVSLYCSKSWYHVPLINQTFLDIHSAAKAVDMYYAAEATQFDGGPDKTCSRY